MGKIVARMERECNPTPISHHYLDRGLVFLSPTWGPVWCSLDAMSGPKDYLSFVFPVDEATQIPYYEGESEAGGWQPTGISLA